LLFGYEASLHRAAQVHPTQLCQSLKWHGCIQTACWEGTWVGANSYPVPRSCCRRCPFTKNQNHARVIARARQPQQPGTSPDPPSGSTQEPRTRESGLWSQGVSGGSEAEKYIEPNSAFMKQLLLQICTGRGFDL